MPTYRNDTSRRITFCDMGYMEWAPGEDKRLTFHAPHEELGLTLVSDEPAAGAAACSWTVELTPGDPITLPLKYHEAFELSIISEFGSAAMKIGSGADEVSITEDTSHFSPYRYARCPYLTFESSGEATLIVKQEKLNTRNTPGRGGA